MRGDESSLVARLNKLSGKVNDSDSFRPPRQAAFFIHRDKLVRRV